jgi:hypothetical protein
MKVKKGLMVLWIRESKNPLLSNERVDEILPLPFLKPCQTHPGLACVSLLCI